MQRLAAANRIPGAQKLWKGTDAAGGFTDIASGSLYEKTAAWAAANGIANGTGNGRFDPNSAITREQLAVILYNYAKYMKYNVSAGKDTNILSYNDAFGISEYAYGALQWTCGAGILGGRYERQPQPAARCHPRGGFLHAPPLHQADRRSRHRVGRRRMTPNGTCTARTAKSRHFQCSLFCLFYFLTRCVIII